MVRVRTRQDNGKECNKVLIAILFKALTSLVETPKSTITSPASTFTLGYSFIVKTIPIFNATKIPCGEHRKFEPFVGYCFSLTIG